MIGSLINVALSITIEATPFLVLGTLLATLVRKWKFFDRAIHKMPSNTLLRRLIAATLGVFMPVCECGNVPMTRSLMQKGFSKAEATTFLLAAPVLNPITFITTSEAFRFAPWVTPARMVGALFVALITGEIVGRLKSPLTKEFAKTCDPKHTHRIDSNKKSFSQLFAEEFWDMLKLLLVGSVIAATFQSIFSQQLFANAGQSIVLGVLIMIGIGFVISICSNVDAFFALAFSGTFRNGALVAFLIAGPMVDIRALTMLRSTYSAKGLLAIVATVGVGAALIGIGLSYVS